MPVSRRSRRQLNACVILNVEYTNLYERAASRILNPLQQHTVDLGFVAHHTDSKGLHLVF